MLGPASGFVPDGASLQRLCELIHSVPQLMAERGLSWDHAYGGILNKYTLPTLGKIVVSTRGIHHNRGRSLALVTDSISQH